MPLHAHEAQHTDTGDSSSTGSTSGIAVALVAIVGLVMIALGMVFVLPYWKKTKRHQTVSSVYSSFSNPVFDSRVHVAE